MKDTSPSLTCAEHGERYLDTPGRVLPVDECRSSFPGCVRQSLIAIQRSSSDCSGSPHQAKCGSRGSGPWRGVAGRSPANNNPPSAPARASGDEAWSRGFARDTPAQPASPDRSRFAPNTSPRSGSRPGPRSGAGRSQQCGPGEIRTHETLSGLPVFKTGAFNRSATGPCHARGAMSIAPIRWRKTRVLAISRRGRVDHHW